MAASTARTCLRSDGDSVHSQKRDQASGRESSKDMVGTLAQLPGRADARSSQAPEPLSESFVIRGGQALSGRIRAAGNKNAALPNLAACLLTSEPVVLHNVPRIRDVETMMALIAGLGAEAEWVGDNEVRVHAADVSSHELDAELSSRIRASFLLAGPLLARLGRASVPPPGGDVIGRRRLDPHIHAFAELGAEVDIGARFELRTDGLRGRHIFLDEASVMATENAVMAASLTPGE